MSKKKKRNGNIVTCYDGWNIFLLYSFFQGERGDQGKKGDKGEPGLPVSWF